MEGENNFSFFKNSDQNYSNFLLEHDLQYPLSTVDSSFTRWSQNMNNIIFPQQQNPLNKPADNVLNLQALTSFSTANFVDQSRQEHLSLLNHLIVDLQKDLRDDLTNNSSSNVTIHHGSDKIKKTEEGGTSSALCIKGQWSEEEDRKIVDLFKVYGPGKWSLIAKQIDGRNGKQCRERWVNHLRPHIKKNTVWSESEEKLIVAVHKIVGNKWAEIARFIPERSENSIKNHWNTTVRRQSSKRKFRRQHETQNGEKPSTVLADYIRGKNFNEASTSNSGNNPSDSPAISDAAASNDGNNPQFIDLTVSSPEYEEEEEPNLHEMFTEDFHQEMNFFGTLFEEDKSASKRLKANGDNININDTSNPSPLPAQMTMQDVESGLLNSSSGFNNMEGSGSIFNTAQNFEYASSSFQPGTYSDYSNVVGSYGDIYDQINFG